MNKFQNKWYLDFSGLTTTGLERNARSLFRQTADGSYVPQNRLADFTGERKGGDENGQNSQAQLHSEGNQLRVVVDDTGSLSAAACPARGSTADVPRDENGLIIPMVHECQYRDMGAYRKLLEEAARTEPTPDKPTHGMLFPGMEFFGPPGEPAESQPEPPPILRPMGPIVQMSDRQEGIVVPSTPPPVQEKPKEKRKDKVKQDSGPVQKIEITPYNTAQKLMRKSHLLTVGSTLYLYNATHYHALSDREAKRFVVSKCREDVKTAGFPKFCDYVYETLLNEPELVQKGFNMNNDLLSFLNGVLSLSTGKIYPHHPKWHTTYCLQCAYSPDAECPHFDAYLREMTGNDPILTWRIWQAIGYVLSPDTNGKVFFLLQGVKNSGKSILSELLRSFFNEEAAYTLDVHVFGERFAVSDLAGKALSLSPDLPDGPLSAEAVSKLKQLTGNDMVSADVKYKDRVQFRCTAKFVLATNHPFLIRNRDDAFFERTVVIPFAHTTPKEKQNHHLLEWLKAERDAIATKAIQAYFDLVQHHYEFAGYYEINAVFEEDSIHDHSADRETAMYAFLKNFFVKEENATVFTDEARALYIERYGYISDNQFTALFERFAGELYGARKRRERKEKGGNPVSCFRGIKFIK